MAIDSGVKGYMIGEATVKQGFPIDTKDVYHIACKYCRFLISQRKCVLTEELVPFPETHTGYQCPFHFRELELDEEDKE